MWFVLCLCDCGCGVISGCFRFCRALRVSCWLGVWVLFTRLVLLVWRVGR